MPHAASNSRLLLLAAAALCCLALGGCGGGGNGDESKPLSKAQYLRKADAICSRTEKRQQKLVSEFGQQNGDPNSPSGTEELISVAAVPPLRLQAEELSQLPLPTHEAAKAKSYLSAFERGISTTANDPQALVSEEPGPFAKAEELAEGFGFKVCAGA
jgi:hypothetical protein